MFLLFNITFIPPTSHNVTLATGQDDDFEYYVDKCVALGGRELILHLSAPTKPGYKYTEQWVCEDVY